MIRIYNILESILGKSKQGYYDPHCSQYQWNCPSCQEENDGMPDMKYNMETNFNIGKCHCWKCGFSGPISRIIKKYGSKDLLNEYFSIVRDLKESRYFQKDLYSDDGTDNYFGDNFLRLPDTYTKIDLKTCRKKKLVEYLNKRKIGQDIIDFYEIGYIPYEEDDKAWRSRLIFPSYDINGDLNYYVGRTFNEGDRRVKYRNCDADKNKIIYHEDKIQWDADIVLCEGVIDSIYFPNTIALLGKTLKKESEIYKKIYEKSNAKIIICLDGDTDLKETKKIYKVLDSEKLKGRIRYIRLGSDELPWKDFGEAYEEVGKGGIIKCIRSAKSFNEIELLF